MQGLQEIRSKGYEPNGIIFREDEVRIILRQTFNWGGGDHDPLPEKMELFGLPIKVQD